MTWYETFGPRNGWAAHRRTTSGLRDQADQPYGASRQAGLPATAGRESRRQRRQCVPLRTYKSLFFDEVLELELGLVLFGADPSGSGSLDVVFLPAPLYGLRFRVLEVAVELRAAFGPLPVGASYLRLFVQAADLRLEGLKLSPSSRHNHTDRLARLEDNGEVSPHYLPVHRESGDGPVGLHNPL